MPALGDLELKGLPDPVPTVEVMWEPVGGADIAERVPLPARLAVRPDVGVVGRSGEVASGEVAYKRVASGGGREVVLVSGEAGLGKTTLAAEVARSAFDSGATVLFGHCEEELATPYQLFAEALGHYVTHAAPGGARGPRGGPRLRAVLPGPRPGQSGPGTATDQGHRHRHRAFPPLRCRGRPDCHDRRGPPRRGRARRPPVGRQGQSSAAPAPGLVGHTAPAPRPRHLPRQRARTLPRAGGHTGRAPPARRVPDRPGRTRRHRRHGADGGRRRPCPRRPGVGLAHAIYRETDGNPFFVGEVLRNLVETGAIRQNNEGRWVPEATLDVTALPDSVREVVGARVLRLGKEAGRILSVAAVIGRDFDLDLLAASTNSDEDDVLDVLDAATEVSLVRELVDTPGRFNFAHALIQHTLYEDLGATRRARAHRAVAEAFELPSHGAFEGSRL